MMRMTLEQNALDLHDGRGRILLGNFQYFASSLCYCNIVCKSLLHYESPKVSKKSPSNCCTALRFRFYTKLVPLRLEKNLESSPLIFFSWLLLLMSQQRYQNIEKIFLFNISIYLIFDEKKIGVQSWEAAHLPTLEIRVEQKGNSIFFRLFTLFFGNKKY